jgi:hypothetical protein
MITNPTRDGECVQVVQGRSCRKGVGRGKGTYAKMRLGTDQASER